MLALLRPGIIPSDWTCRGELPRTYLIPVESKRAGREDRLAGGCFRNAGGSELLRRFAPPEVIDMWIRWLQSLAEVARSGLRPSSQVLCRERADGTAESCLQGFPTSDVRVGCREHRRRAVSCGASRRERVSSGFQGRFLRWQAVSQPGPHQDTRRISGSWAEIPSLN